MTGRIIYAPRARQQLRNLEEWIAGAASQDVAQRYLAGVLDHIDAIAVFPLSGRSREDLRPGDPNDHVQGPYLDRL